MADAYISLDSLLFRPSDGPDLWVLKRGMLMIEPLLKKPVQVFQRDAIIGSKWINQEPRGNAQIDITVTTTIPYNTQPDADQAVNDMSDYVLSHPKGQLIHYGSYDKHGQETDGRVYCATIETCEPQGINTDYCFGHVQSMEDRAAINQAAWRAFVWHFVCTQMED